MVFSAAPNGVFEAPPYPVGTSRDFWYDEIDEDEATHELREVLGHKSAHFQDFSPAFGGRCPSAVSTQATLSPHPLRFCTPPPPTTSPPQSDSSEGAAFDASDQSPAHAQAPMNGTARNKAALWNQCRKVFVGGVPQSTDQNHFYEMFNQIGQIDKAWLQWQHDGEGHVVPKHRGFGFVIFRDRRTVDQLLGQELSKHIWFGNALKLEVKRAFGKTDPVWNSPQGEYPEVKQALDKVWSMPLAQPPLCDYARYNNKGSPKQKLYGSNNPSPISPTWQINSPPTSKSWQSHPWLYPSLPGVPPFPCMESEAMGPSQSRGGSTTTTAARALTTLPDPSNSDLVTSTLFGGLAGQKPRDRQELEQMLRAAQPDHYED